MEKIRKSDLDEAIRTCRKFFKENGYDELLEEYNKAKKKAFGKIKRNHWLDNIITGITLKREDYNEPYKTYYKVLEALGFEIVEG